MCCVLCVEYLNRFINFCPLFKCLGTLLVPYVKRGFFALCLCCLWFRSRFMKNSRFVVCTLVHSLACRMMCHTTSRQFPMWAWRTYTVRAHNSYENWDKCRRSYAACKKIYLFLWNFHRAPVKNWKIHFYSHWLIWMAVGIQSMCIASNIEQKTGRKWIALDFSHMQLCVWMPMHLCVAPSPHFYCRCTCISDALRRFPTINPHISMRCIETRQSHFTQYKSSRKFADDCLSTHSPSPAKC